MPVPSQPTWPFPGMSPKAQRGWAPDPVKRRPAGRERAGRRAGPGAPVLPSSLTPVLRASASDVHFPSAPASQTDSLPRQGSNFQNKTFSTKENITVRRKTFQYHASWDPRKCTERLSGSGAVLASQALLRTAGEQWLAPGTSQAEWPARGPGWSSSCPGSKESSVCPPSCLKAGPTVVGQISLRIGALSCPIPILPLPFQPKGDAHGRRAVWQKGCLLLSWVLGNG